MTPDNSAGERQERRPGSTNAWDIIDTAFRVIEENQEQENPDIYSWALGEYAKDPTSQTIEEMWKSNKYDRSVVTLHKLAFLRKIFSDVQVFGENYKIEGSECAEAYQLAYSLFHGEWNAWYLDNVMQNLPEDEFKRKLLINQLAVENITHFTDLLNDYGIFTIHSSTDESAALFHGPQIVRSENVSHSGGQTSSVSESHVRVLYRWVPIAVKKWNGTEHSKAYFENEKQFIKFWQTAQPEHFMRTSAGQVVSPEADEIRMVYLHALGDGTWQDFTHLLNVTDTHTSDGYYEALYMASAATEWLATVSQFADIGQDIVVDGKGIYIRPDKLMNYHQGLRTIDYGSCRLFANGGDEMQSRMSQRRALFDPELGILCQSGFIDIEPTGVQNSSYPQIELDGQRYYLRVPQSLIEMRYKKKYGIELSKALAEACADEHPASNVQQILTNLRMTNCDLPIDHNSLEDFRKSTQLALSTRCKREKLLQPLIDHILEATKLPETQEEKIALGTTLLKKAGDQKLKSALKRLKIILAVESRTSRASIEKEYLNTDNGKIDLIDGLIGLARSVKKDERN
jgi:hypothetical protein